MREFETTLKTDANNVIALYNVGRAKDSLGKTEEAIAIYNHILTIVPGYKDAYIALAAIESNRRNFKRAMDLYLEGLKYHPENGDLHGRLGSQLLQMGRVDEAIKELQTAAKLKADSGVYGNLGVAMLSKGDAAGAAGYFNRAIKLNPANAEAHYNLGNIFLSQQLPAKAADEYKLAIKVKPNYAKAFSNLGVAFEQMGQLDNAIESYRRAIESDPNNVDARFNLAMKLSDKGLFDEAAAEYEQVLKINPADEDARAGLEKIKAGKIPAAPPVK
jgi:tetratricopeptide (TPR) repeat protein